MGNVLVKCPGGGAMNHLHGASDILMLKLLLVQHA
jgi:hypothetical protein